MILAVYSTDVFDPASSVFPIQQSWPFDDNRSTVHMVRAVRSLQTIHSLLFVSFFLAILTD
jgi:hypothetical protein